MTALYRLGALVARTLPSPIARALPDAAAFPLSWALRSKRSIVKRHMRRALPPDTDDKAVNVATRKAFASYTRYWIESFRLPTRSGKQLTEGIEVPDYHYVEEALSRGNGVILALPHLGGWEWAGFWMASVNNLPINVVVEPIEPPELFNWFASFRSKLGMKVVPLGSSSGTQIVTALKNNEIVCLLCDRDIAGGGIEVSFLGEHTTLPGGPALMALRTGAALLPTAVYFGPKGNHLGLVRPPIDVARTGTIKEDVSRVTNRVAQELEFLIRKDPEQWHLFQPNWPSDLVDQT